MNRNNEEVIPEAVYQLLLRLKTYETVFSLQAVCIKETPDGTGRFQLYKQFSYLELRNYLWLVQGTGPDNYSLAPKAWEYLIRMEGYRSGVI